MCLLFGWVRVSLRACTRLVSSSLHMHLAMSRVFDEGLFPGVSDGD